MEAAGCQVLIRTTSAAFGTEIERLMRSFPGCGNNAVAGARQLRLSVEVKPPLQNHHAHPFHYVYRECDFVGKSTEWWQLFRFIEWQLDIFLSGAVTDRLLLHGGAVAKNDAGLLLLGESGSGKSSMTLALLERGYRYYTDDLIIIDPETAQLHPFPKPFSLKSQALFPHLRHQQVWLGPDGSRSPRPRQNGGRNSAPVWYIHPDDVWDRAVANRPVPVRAIFFPTYVKNATPRLEPLTSGQAMRRLLENTVNFNLLGSGGLSLAASLIKNARCFDLTVNGPAVTAELIEQAL